MNQKLIKAFFALSISGALLTMSGCQNTNQKELDVIQKQSRTIEQLAQEKASLQKQLDALKLQIKQQTVSADTQGRIASANSVFEAKLQKLIDSLSVELSRSFQDTEEANDVHVIRNSDDSVTIRIEERVLFRSGSATLTDSGRKVLERITTIVRDNPSRFVRIDGHSDTDPIKKSKFSSNWDISSKRAVAVIEALTKKGALDPNNMFVAGFGEYRPLGDNKAANRRVEITLINK